MISPNIKKMLINSLPIGLINLFLELGIYFKSINVDYIFNVVIMGIKKNTEVRKKCTNTLLMKLL